VLRPVAASTPASATNTASTTTCNGQMRAMRRHQKRSAPSTPLPRSRSAQLCHSTKPERMKNRSTAR
jgi:hypothetical protein